MPDLTGGLQAHLGAPGPELVHAKRYETITNSTRQLFARRLAMNLPAFQALCRHVSQSLQAEDADALGTGRPSKIRGETFEILWQPDGQAAVLLTYLGAVDDDQAKQGFDAGHLGGLAEAGVPLFTAPVVHRQRAHGGAAALQVRVGACAGAARSPTGGRRGAGAGRDHAAGCDATGQRERTGQGCPAECG